MFPVWPVACPEDFGSLAQDARGDGISPLVSALLPGTEHVKLGDPSDEKGGRNGCFHANFLPNPGPSIGLQDRRAGQPGSRADSSISRQSVQSGECKTLPQECVRLFFECPRVADLDLPSGHPQTASQRADQEAADPSMNVFDRGQGRGPLPAHFARSR